MNIPLPESQIYLMESDPNHVYLPGSYPIQAREINNYCGRIIQKSLQYYLFLQYKFLMSILFSFIFPNDNLTQNTEIKYCDYLYPMFQNSHQPLFIFHLAPKTFVLSFYFHIYKHSQINLAMHVCTYMCVCVCITTYIYMCVYIPI